MTITGVFRHRFTLREAKMNVALPTIQGCAVAYGRSSSAGAATEQCARQLRDSNPLMLVVFAGGKHDYGNVLGVFQSEFPGVPIVGGSAAGAISRDGFGYSGLEVGALAITDPRILPKVIVSRDLLAGEYEAGVGLGRELRREAPDDGLVLMFFDSVANASPLRLHPASAIVDGVQDGLGDKAINLVGGGLLTDLNLGGAWVFDGSRARKHAILALVFPRRVTATTELLHGCRPVSTFMEITKVEGSIVHELDGRPALTVLEEMLGLHLAGKTPDDLNLIATLGSKQGDPFAPFSERAYVNRLILGGDRATGSIMLFEPDFKPGMLVQVMGRDNELMLQSVRDGVERANAVIGGGDSLFSLYVDCAGRASAHTGAVVEEADLVRQHLDRTIPFLGFYSGVEIAPFHGRSRALDWTGVLTIVRYTS